MMQILSLPVSGGSPRSVVANVLDCNIKISNFKLWVSYNIHFWINIFQKGMNPVKEDGFGI